MSVLMKTESLCPYCLRRIPAYYEIVDGEVFLAKECPEHGKIRILFWRDAMLYEKWLAQSIHAEKQKGKPYGDKGCPFECGICAAHEGGVCTAVLEITYRCNLDCAVCFADATKTVYEPTLEEIGRMYQKVYDNGGFCSVQISGGEPTVREDLPQIIKMGKAMGFPHIQVNTNGLKLAFEPGYAALLKETGADLIYLQFDGVRDDIYQKIRGRSLLDIKIKAIENCKAAGIGVLLVPTVIPGINLHCFGEIVHFAKANMPIVKGIHFQPVSYFGRFPGDIPTDEARCSLSDVMHGLEEQTSGEIMMKDLVPRKRFDAHCAFSSLFYLSEEGMLQAITKEEQNTLLNSSTDFAKKANSFTNAHWRIASKESGSNDINAMSKFKERLRDYTLSISGMGFQDVWNVDIGRLRGCCVHVITGSGQAVPLCAFHLTSVTGERLYKNA